MGCRLRNKLTSGSCKKRKVRVRDAAKIIAISRVGEACQLRSWI